MLVPRAKRLEEVILKLLAIEHEVSIRSIARFAGMSEVDDADRKAIRRAMSAWKHNNSSRQKVRGALECMW